MMMYEVEERNAYAYAVGRPLRASDQPVSGCFLLLLLRLLAAGGEFPDYSGCNAWLIALGSDMIRRRRPAIFVLRSVLPGLQRSVTSRLELSCEGKVLLRLANLPR